MASALLGEVLRGRRTSSLKTAETKPSGAHSCVMADPYESSSCGPGRGNHRKRYVAGSVRVWLDDIVCLLRDGLLSLLGRLSFGRRGNGHLAAAIQAAEDIRQSDRTSRRRIHGRRQWARVEQGDLRRGPSNNAPPNPGQCTRVPAAVATVSVMCPRAQFPVHITSRWHTSQQPTEGAGRRRGGRRK